MPDWFPTLALPRSAAVAFRPQTRHWTVLGVGGAALSAYALLGDSVLNQILYAVIGSLAVAALTVSAVLKPTRARLAWLMIAVSQVTWAIGDIVWTAINLAGGIPYPSVADVFYAIGYPLLAAGLALLLWRGNRGIGWGDLVDVAIITLAALFVLWPVVFAPILEGEASWTTVVALSYSTGDVLLLGLLAALCVHGDRRSPVVWLIGCSLILSFAADLIFYVPTLGVTALAETWSNCAWLAAYILLAAAGIHPGERRKRTWARAVESSPLRRLRFVGIALLTMPAAYAVEHLAGSGSMDWRASVAINGAVAVLVVLRLSILLAEVDRARNETAHAKGRFETVFESAGVGISITENGTLKRTNPAFQKLVGYTSDELATMRVSDIVHPDDFDPRVDPASIGDGGHATHERRFIHRDGHIVYARINLTYSAATDLSIAVIEDVTTRRVLEEQMREAQKLEAVGRLAGGIAHDFNNILTVVSGHTELLRDYLPPDAEDDVNTILDSVRRANDLTRQLLTFSRREDPVRTLIEPADIFRDTEILMRNVIGGTVILETSIASSSPAVVADPVQLSQVVLNLAVNARDSMPDGGTLTFTVDDLRLDAAHEAFPGVASGLYCRVIVEDTGCGMDEATRARVFEPFYSTKQVGKGTGLGLAITYGIVTQAGGHIFVDSEVGRGTRFEILLPAAAVPPPSVADRQAA